MFFSGFGKVFSTVGDSQYETIGAFWDEMSSRFGRENLRGLGCHWTADSIEYLIGLRKGALSDDEPLPEGAAHRELILPDHNWTVYTGKTSELDQMYGAIYQNGPLDFEIETFADDGNCEVHIFRKNTVPDIADAILARRSYRGRYCSAAVPLNDLRKIAEAGLAAPSGCNIQTTSLAIVNTPEMMNRILAVIDPPVAVTAPAGIFVLTRRINAYRDRCFATQDYSAAIENMLIAVTAMGYASCWFEGHITDADRICDRIAGILGIPGEYDLVCFLPVGIPETEPKKPQKKPDAERCFFVSCSE